MDQQKLDMYMLTNSKFFAPEKIGLIKDKLASVSDDKWNLVSSLELKDPKTLLLISIFVGALGVDRFMIGDTGMGVLKLLTAGGCGILSIYDWFTIQKKVQDYNFSCLMNVL